MDVGDVDLDPPGVGKYINLVEDVVDPNLEFVQDSGCEGSMENMEFNPSSNMCFESGCVGNGIRMENMELLNPSSPLIGSQQVVYTSPIQTVRTVQTVETVVSTNVPLVEPPKEGMVFKSWEDIEEYFKMYAFSNGFGVTRVQGSFSKATKERRGTRWRCECWGPPNMRALREAKKRAKAMEVGGTGGKVNGVIGVDELKQGKRKSKKCFCPANIYASVNDAGEWVIRSAELEHHGHKPTPTKANLVKEYRMKHYTSSVRKKLMNFYEEGVPVKKIHGCLSHEKDKLPNVKDLEHEVYKAKKLKMEGGDAVAMMKYFEKMQADNQNFYHAHRLDEEGRLKDVLWVDARSRAAYKDFGDVVCFDATYLTNNYDLPFANFVGVNHHGQSILFGCALVSREDCETYSWVFTQWLACMGNRAPLGILTDQAEAMRRPLAEIMPTARHRWCI
ncbi:protein FAR1-RELATED SEQUENCE 8-like isoform X1 [Chenopodium quinoa]|uniref:protein FAR1-RELATED SEQUENCE 8-like isoform X1 n=1 Tax=Chenopodium quinoa TaxID=63459 RepID=UPI000B7997EF|nr:protein FAR1-RELATED SEQUENCE 8-like isoform X1 [Chenopodium quinoa]